MDSITVGVGYFSQYQLFAVDYRQNYEAHCSFVFTSQKYRSNCTLLLPDFVEIIGLFHGFIRYTLNNTVLYAVVHVLRLCLLGHDLNGFKITVYYVFLPKLQM